MDYQLSSIHYLPTTFRLTPPTKTRRPRPPRQLINQLLDNATLSTSTTTSPRATGKSRTTTALAILQLKQEIQP